MYIVKFLELLPKRPDNWTEEQLAPYLDTALEAFGPSRLMFGSDWPVALLAVDYANWVGIVEKFASKLTDSEQARLWGETAIEAYKLSVQPAQSGTINP